jgi:hypothetical protein
MAVSQDNSGSAGSTIAETLDTSSTTTTSSGTTGSSSSRSRSRSRSFNFTPRESAYSQLDQNMMALFGRRATAAEKKDYYKKLHAAEKRYSSRSRGSTRSGSTTDAQGNTVGGSSSSDVSTSYSFDQGSFLFEYTVGLAKKYINSGKSFGGQAAENMNAIKSYAADMGISVSEDTALSDTIGTVIGTGDVNTLKQDYRKRAIALYGGLAERLNTNPNLTVRDAASDYMETMASMLDIDAKTLSLQDNTLQKALTASKDGKPYTMTLNEFRANLRQDNRFQYSNMAKQEATNLGSNLARIMGFGSR